MRIISGKLKGRKISLRIPDNVRPTTDSLRETIFNILANYIEFENLVVADVCAGTGMMGFEALSRAASRCDFIEKSRSTANLIKHIADIFEINKNDYSIIIQDAEKYFNKQLSPNSQKYDLIFIDPPYASLLSNKIIESIIKSESIRENGIIVAETAINETLLIPPELNIITERISGTTKISLLQNQK